MPKARPHGSESRAERVPLYILAGGRSSRFGSDKALVEIAGEPLILRLAQGLAPLAASITVIASRPGVYDHLGLRTIGDVVVGKGPIGGLLTAIHDRREGGWMFVSACDWAGVRPEWAAALMSRRSAGAQAVVFRPEHYEPLFALYHTSISDVVRSRIASGMLAMHELLAAVDTVSVPAPSGWAGVRNVNRPSDLGEL